LGHAKPQDHTLEQYRQNPEDWVSGDEPMTGAQASYLKTLTEQAHEPSLYQDNLTKAEASKLIDTLREKVGLGTSDQ
jgi:hypothetical protein